MSFGHAIAFHVSAAAASAAESADHPIVKPTQIARGAVSGRRRRQSRTILRYALKVDFVAKAAPAVDTESNAHLETIKEKYVSPRNKMQEQK
jgi:hypothetical protein